jgi:hypothetical protein
MQKGASGISNKQDLRGWGDRGTALREGLNDTYKSARFDGSYSATKGAEKHSCRRFSTQMGQYRKVEAPDVSSVSGSHFSASQYIKSCLRLSVLPRNSCCPEFTECLYMCTVVVFLAWQYLQASGQYVSGQSAQSPMVHCFESLYIVEW